MAEEQPGKDRKRKRRESSDCVEAAKMCKAGCSTCPGSTGPPSKVRVRSASVDYHDKNIFNHKCEGKNHTTTTTIPAEKCDRTTSDQIVVRFHSLDAKGNKQSYYDTYTWNPETSLKKFDDCKDLRVCGFTENHEKNDRDSAVGEKTPHGSTIKEKEDLVEQDCVLTPLKVRNIPIPSVSWADSRELATLMCFKEDVLCKERDALVFKKHANLTPRMRAILLEWIMEVCEVYKLRRVTYYLAIDYIDRYLSLIDELPKNQLQLLGITCLFVAAKVEEVYPPKLADLAYVTDGACTDEEMLMKELAVLKVLRWDVSPMTVSGWLNLYMQICYNTKNIRDVSKEKKSKHDDFIFPQFSSYNFVRASQLTDICSFDEGMLLFQYSVIAASAMYYVFNRERALYVSGFTWEQIKDCVSWMRPFYQVVSQNEVFGASEGPKDRYRGSSGLKKENPKILVNEAHSVQTHAVTLKMLEEVYQLMNSDSEETSPEETSPEIEELPSLGTNECLEGSVCDDNDCFKNASGSPLLFHSEDTLLDATDIPLEDKYDKSCDLYKTSVMS